MYDHYEINTLYIDYTHIYVNIGWEIKHPSHAYPFARSYFSVTITSDFRPRLVFVKSFFNPSSWKARIVCRSFDFKLKNGNSLRGQTNVYRSLRSPGFIAVGLIFSIFFYLLFKMAVKKYSAHTRFRAYVKTELPYFLMQK